jgi:hypothetical protein
MVCIEQYVDGPGGMVAVEGNIVWTYTVRDQLFAGLRTERIVANAADEEDFIRGVGRNAGGHLSQDCGKVCGRAAELWAIGKQIPQEFSDRRNAQGFPHDFYLYL